MEPPKDFCKKGALQNCAILETPVESSKPATEKETPVQVFSLEFCEILKNTNFVGYLQTAVSGSGRQALS